MPIYNLIEYSENYSKTFGSLWKYQRDESHDSIANSDSFKSKMRMTVKSSAADNT